MDQNKQLKNALRVFAFSFGFRVMCDAFFCIYKDYVARVVVYQRLLATAFLLIYWSTSSLMPTAFIFYTHFKNFVSFQTDEVLHTEYSVDDNLSEGGGGDGTPENINNP